MTKNIEKNIVVAQTDPDWYKYLEQNRRGDFVNFWRTSTTRMKQVELGSLFLFKLLGTQTTIAGWGTYVETERLTVHQAWEKYQNHNGVESFSELTKKTRSGPTEEISCNILTNVTFLKKEDWFSCPGWHPKSQNPIKYYPINEEFGIELRQQILLSAYENSCAISGEDTSQKLIEATNIVPTTDQELEDFSNQIVFRKDINKLFNDGLVSVTPDRVFHVSKEIQNSNSIKDLDESYTGKKIKIPLTGILRPDAEFLHWHYNHRF